MHMVNSFSDMNNYSQREGWSGRDEKTIPLASPTQGISRYLELEQELRRVREELDHRVEARAAELRVLYEQAQEAAVLQERQRLARDLHDAVTQMLFSASLIAEVLPRIWERDPDKARQHLEDLRMLTRGALAEMRTLLRELRPAAFDEARLSDLLQQTADALMGKVGIPVTLTVRDTRSHRVAPLPLDVRTALYRVAQEALNNVAKHAAAGKVTITVDQRPGRVDLSIQDDGKGFDAQRVTADHLGLGIMRERVAAIGGTLSVESAPGAGTCIRVQWRG
jgi:signal transduction histidine kinase